MESRQRGKGPIECLCSFPLLILERMEGFSSSGEFFGDGREGRRKGATSSGGGDGLEDEGSRSGNSLRSEQSSELGESRQSKEQRKIDRTKGLTSAFVGLCARAFRRPLRVRIAMLSGPGDLSAGDRRAVV